MQHEIGDLLEEATKQLGKARVVELLKQAMERAPSKEVNTLTIVSNAGVHHLPDGIVHGELFIVSRGNLDFSEIRTVENEYVRVLLPLARKLKERRWERVILIPFGHATLSIQIKLLVYRISHVETEDYFYTKDIGYQLLKISTREIATSVD